MTTEPGAGHVALTDAETTPHTVDAPVHLAAVIGTTDAARVAESLTELTRRMVHHGVDPSAVLLALHDAVDEAVHRVAPVETDLYLARPLTDYPLPSGNV